MKSPLRKILAIDDDQDLLTVTKYCLEESKTWEVRIAICGEEGISIAEDFLPDLILLDVMMPDVDGIETLAKMRTIEVLKNIPVIFFTAKIQAHEIQKYKNLDIIGVITKPFDPFKLKDEVARLWENKSEACWNSLKKKYKHSIPEKLEQIEALILQLKNEKDMESLHSLRFAVHKLVGSAGTYGYEVVSQHGSEFLNRVDALIKDFDPEKINDLDLCLFLKNIKEGFTDAC